jgi:hypothetical protein
LHLSDYSTIHQVQIYLHLINTTLRIKKEFEVDIHPTSLLKFQHKYNEIINQMCELILDLVKIPKSNLVARMTYTDYIIQHAERKIITKEHLIERLFSWENFDIIEQAD